MSSSENFLQASSGQSVCGLIATDANSQQTLISCSPLYAKVKGNRSFHEPVNEKPFPWRPLRIPAFEMNPFFKNLVRGSEPNSRHTLGQQGPNECGPERRTFQQKPLAPGFPCMGVRQRFHFWQHVFLVVS